MSEMIRMKPCSAVARPLAPDAIVQDTPRGAPRTTPAPLGPPGRAALVIAAMVGVVAGTATAGDWPQILGPERSGRAAADERLADAWPAGGPKVVWKRDVGHGYAGVVVVVAADRALLFHRRGCDEVIEAPSAANASDRLLNGPSTGPPTGPMSAHQLPSESGSTRLARVIVSRPSARRSKLSS